MPFLYDFRLTFADQSCDSTQFSRSEATVVFHAYRFQSELCRLAFAVHMNVRRLATIAREEEQSIRPRLQNGQTHTLIVSVLASTWAMPRSR